MPIILQFTFEDGSKEVVRIPAEIWRRQETTVTKVFIFDKKVTSILLDPFLEIADTDVNNNSWPTKQSPTKFDLYKNKQSNKHH